MEHRQFINFILSENATRPQFPTSGLTLQEAIVRWVGYAATFHWWTFHRPAPCETVPSVTNVWQRWERDGREDVDLSLPAAEGPVQAKIQVVELDLRRPSGEEIYELCLNDYQRREEHKATGIAVRDRDRLFIRHTVDPYVSPLANPLPAQAPLPARPRISRRRDPETLSVRLQQCCRAALNNIRRIVENWSTVQLLLGAAVWGNIFGIDTSAAGTAPIRVLESREAIYQFEHQEWELWAQAMGGCSTNQRAGIRDEAMLEQVRHDSEADLKRFWTIIHDSAAIPRSASPG